MEDQLVRATAVSGGIRAVGVITTQLTQEAQRRHQLSGVATLALGQTMTAGLLLASSMKAGRSRVNVWIRGNGPLGSISVDAGFDGTVRGYVDHPDIELPDRNGGRLDVGAAIGRDGYVHVLRDDGYGIPYTSSVELVSGEIDQNIAYYLSTSEQTPSALALDVSLEAEQVTAAGGLILQVLPKVARDEALVQTLKSRFAALSGFNSLLQDGKSLPEIFEQLMGDLDLVVFPGARALRFQCRCSFDRVLGALKMLGQAELEDMIHKDEGAEAICHFCGEVYRPNTSDLEQVLQEMRQEPVASEE
jgi:molecular chaperone Hsp33